MPQSSPKYAFFHEAHIYSFFVIFKSANHPYFFFAFPIIKSLVDSPIAERRVLSSIPARSHTFVEIGHETLSTVILLLSLVQLEEGLVPVTNESKKVHEVLVNSLVKDKTIAVDWGVKL